MPTDTPPAALPHLGLTPAEVEASRQKHGRNVLTPPERDPWWKQWLSKFEDPVIRILMIAAAIQIAVGAYKGEFIEGLAIVVAILLATTLAFVNEFKANREFDILNKVNDDTPVKVVRGGQFTTVPRSDVVVGDIVLVEAGEEVPCDGELVDAVALLVDESKLTGESVPVTKTTADKVGEVDPKWAYPRHLVNRGTMLADGHGTFRATAVGDGTEIGKTAKAAGEEQEGDSPLNEQLDRLSKIIGIVGLAIAGATFLVLVARGALTGGLVLSSEQWTFALIVFAAILVGLARVWVKITWEGVLALKRQRDLDAPEYLDEDSVGRWLVALGAGAAVLGLGLGVGSAAGWLPTGEWLPSAAGQALLNYFMIAVVIIVVAVPEGLAMSVTLSLAYSMRKMTAQNTLVRKMHACETIGATTVICSDKTGTLTMNQMRVAEMRVPALAGGALSGAPGDTGALVVNALAVNSTAQLAREEGALRALGNPTEGALLVWLDGAGVNYIVPRTTFAVGTQLPFSTDRKYMATTGTDPAGRKVLHVKGAPEIVLERCETVLAPAGSTALDQQTRTAIAKELKDLQARGMRTIGFAYRDVADPAADAAEQIGGLTWLGFAALTDPVRPEVPGAVAACRSAGLEVKIVTGDTPDTAREIGRQIGLIGEAEEPGAEMTGVQFAALSDEDARAAVGRLKILARARPMDKLRLVRLLQDQRAVVAVTGDGTNDAPALNHAKVGLAMGRTGTAVAKEAADIVLLDDSFGSIVNALRWGRALYENIQRFILFQLTINVVALGIALLGPFVGVNLPLTVMQMLWVNLIMDTFAALALATEPPHEGVLRRRPRDPDAFIVTAYMAKFVFGVGAVFLAILVGLIFVLPGLRDPASTEHAHSLTVFFSVFVLLQFWNLFNARCLGNTASAFVGVFQNKAFLLIAAVILFGQIALVQFGGDVFRTVPLTVSEWVAIILATAPVLVIGEAVRLKARMAQKSPAATPAPGQTT
jgi:Ca2+-transporting ATPase